MDTTTETPPDEPAPQPAPPAEPPPQPPTRPRLERRTDDRILGGVASGIADHFGVEPLVVRLVFLVAAFFGGIGVIAYVAMWIIVPSGPESPSPVLRDRRQLLGYGLVALGLAVIPGRLGLEWGFGNGAFWPLVLIATGGAVLWLRTRDDRDAPPDPPRPDPPRPDPPPPDPQAPAASSSPVAARVVAPPNAPSGPTVETTAAPTAREP